MTPDSTTTVNQLKYLSRRRTCANYEDNRITHRRCNFSEQLFPTWNRVVKTCRVRCALHVALSKLRVCADPMQYTRIPVLYCLYAALFLLKLSFRGVCGLWRVCGLFIMLSDKFRPFRFVVAQDPVMCTSTHTPTNWLLFFLLFWRAMCFMEVFSSLVHVMSHEDRRLKLHGRTVQDTP